MAKEKRIIDNQVFLLGLDEIYRKKMKIYEKGELLTAARQIIDELRVPIEEVPIEGYYHEDENLTEYFRLMKTLQFTSITREKDIKSKSIY